MLPFLPKKKKKVSTTASLASFPAFTRSLKCSHIRHRIGPSQVPTELGRAGIFIPMLHNRKQDSGYGMVLNTNFKGEKRDSYIEKRDEPK